MTGSFSFAFESAFLQLFGQSDNKYTRPDDYFAEDVMKFIKDFQPDRLMSCVPGRAHPSFPGFVRRTAIRKPAKMGSHIKKLANNMDFWLRRVERANERDAMRCIAEGPMLRQC